MTKHQFALENFKNVQSLIKFVDQKAGAVLVIYGLILTVFLDFSKNLPIVNPFSLSTLTKICTYFFTLISAFTLIVILTYQIYLILVKIIRPRLAKHYKQDELSIFYFEHIARMTKYELIEQNEKLSEVEILNEIIGQTYEAANIMNSKTKQLAKAINHVYISVIIFIAFVLLSRIS